MEIIQNIISEIKELNSLDNKSITERTLKYGEEYGEFCAELGKLIGITHKPYDRTHLVEEMADTIQNLFSIYIGICDITDITIEEVLENVLIKNNKWRNKIPLYTRNNNILKKLK